MPDAALESGWTRVAFGEMVRQVRDRVDPKESGLEHYVTGEHMNSDDLRIRRWGIIGDGYLGPAFQMRFKPGHVLYGSRRTYLRKVAVADFEGITANTTFVLEPKEPNALLPELLPFIMQTESFHEHSIKESKGSVNPYVNFSDLAGYEFALPPVKEQRQITDVLLRSEHLRSAYDEVLCKHGKVTESKLHELLRQEQESTVTLGDVALRVTNGFVGSAVKHYTDEGVPYLRSMNIRRTGIDLTELVHITQSFHENTTKSQLQAGDLLTVQSGHVGETAVVPPICEGCNCHALILTRLNQQKAVPEYVAIYLNSIDGQRNLARYYVGSTVLHLNTSDLARLIIPLPKISQQQKIAAVYETLLETRKLISSRRKGALRLRSDLLAWLLEPRAMGDR